MKCILQFFSSSFYTQCQPLFLFAKFRPKAKLKIQKKSDFESFHSPKVREKLVKMLDFYIWFSVCSQKYRRMIKALHKLLTEIWPLGMITFFFLHLPMEQLKMRKLCTDEVRGAKMGYELFY